MFVVLESRGLKPPREDLDTFIECICASFAVVPLVVVLHWWLCRFDATNAVRRELVSRCGPSYDPQQGVEKTRDNVIHAFS